MIKNIIAPIQAWLLSQKRCVGCGTSLLMGNRKMVNNKEKVTCKCRRVYIKEGTLYRRAKLDEV